MMFIVDHIGCHLMILAAGWLLSTVWPFVRQPTWPETPHFDVRYGWAILTVALLASLGWVFLFWQLQGRR